VNSETPRADFLWGESTHFRGYFLPNFKQLIFFFLELQYFLSNLSCWVNDFKCKIFTCQNKHSLQLVCFLYILELLQSVIISRISVIVIGTLESTLQALRTWKFLRYISNITLILYVLRGLVKKFSAKSLEFLKKGVIFFLLLRCLDYFVDNRHYIRGVVSIWIVFYNYFIVPEKIVLFVVAVGDFPNKTFEFVAGPFGVGLRVLPDDFWADRLKIFINSVHKLRVDLDIHIFVNSLTGLFDVEEDIFSSEGLPF